jgi:uncharacterized protein
MTDEQTGKTEIEERKPDEGLSTRKEDPRHLPAPITPELFEFIKDHFVLSLFGIHGIIHWKRVYDNAMRIYQETPLANPTVLTYFAFLHDLGRRSDEIDRNHGRRSAEMVTYILQDKFLHLPEEELCLLVEAIRWHNAGMTEADITVQVCWDADRLDLGRVFIRPNPRYLCTPTAKKPEVIAWAEGRSQRFCEIPFLE